MPRTPAALTAAEFAAEANVSRETLARLSTYLELLRRWQTRINLVSAASLGDPWRRHFLDSAQLYPLIGAGRAYDIGSGAGFPGLVLAMMGHPDMHLIESDLRKAEFLRETARITSTKLSIYPARAESLSPRDADFVIARAVAPLAKLISLAAPFLRNSGVCIFLKGRESETEIAEARKSWTMRVERRMSISDSSGVILRLEDIHRV